VIHQSDLIDEDLAELWDVALSAKFRPTLGRPEYHLGCIDKVEFFFSLSELQTRLALPIDAFCARLGHETTSSIASSDSTLWVVKRGNPFKGGMKSTAPTVPLRLPKLLLMFQPQKEHKTQVRTSTCRYR
jgi:hypothetical protein